VNNIATQLEKNTWKHTGGGSATDCGDEEVFLQWYF